MGLMEKALQYKKEMNSLGKETLIDRIQGPAETEMMEAAAENRAEPLPDEALTDLVIDEPLDELLDVDAGPEAPSVSADESAAEELFALPDDAAVVDKTEDLQGSRDDAAAEELFALPDDTAAAAAETPVEERPAEQTVSVTKAPAADGEEPLSAEDEPPILKKKPAAADKPDGPSPLQGETTVEEPGEAPHAKSVESLERLFKHSKKFHDFMVLFEISKEIVKARTRAELYDVILFSIMGQIGASSSSILIPDQNDLSRWIIADFRGISVKNKELRFDPGASILGLVVKKRELIDLEDYKNSPEHKDEYFEFVSIDARLLSPLSFDGKVYGAVSLGEKITIGDYTDAEKDFIVSVCEVAAIALHKLNMIEQLRCQIESESSSTGLLNQARGVIDVVSRYGDLGTIGGIIQTEFEQMGVQGFAVFLWDELSSSFVPRFTEAADYCSIMEGGFRLDHGNPLPAFLQDNRERVLIENPGSSDIASRSFPASMLKKMPLLWLYPFRIGADLSGFLAVFRIAEEAKKSNIDFQLSQLMHPLFSHILAVSILEEKHGRYVDAVEGVMSRIRASFDNARSLGIPFTLVLFSIKNFKRFYNLYGYEKSRELIGRFQRVISERLSDTDFAVRMDRSRILLVLSGKNKKFAVPLANAIRNEIAQEFGKKEMPLLLVHLTAEYPEDGDDLYPLLDSLLD